MDADAEAANAAAAGSGSGGGDGDGKVVRGGSADSRGEGGSVGEINVARGLEKKGRVDAGKEGGRGRGGAEGEDGRTIVALGFPLFTLSRFICACVNCNISTMLFSAERCSTKLEAFTCELGQLRVLDVGEAWG